MSSRKRFESGFIGEKRARGRDEGYDEVYAGDLGDPSGFVGVQGARGGNNPTVEVN